MFSPLRRYFRTWLGNRRGVIPWLGGPLYFPRDSLVALSILRTGQWEPEVTPLLTTAARPGTVVFDVGANIGASALSVLDRHPDTRVVSFEPSPTVLPHLTRTWEASRFRDRWEVVPKAVTERPGEVVPFIAHPGPGGDVYEGLRATGRGTPFDVEVKVQTTSIDADWDARGRPPVSLLKVDVEGGELGVLAGAAECLAACRPAVITEWCPTNFLAYGCAPMDLLRLAAEAGYDAFLIPGLYPLAADPRVLPFQLAAHENVLLLPRP
jgi:FkbM family methyltransferase